MHQPGAQACGLLGQHAGGGGVEQARKLRFTLGLVHSGVGGSVDDDVGAEPAHSVADAFRLAEIAAVLLAIEVQRRHLAQHGQAALQFPADLAALAQQQDVHAATPVGAY